MPVLTVLNCWVKKSTTFTLTIIHLVYPPKFCISVVSSYLGRIVNPKKKGKQCVYKTLVGGGGGGGGGWETRGNGEM